MHWTHFDAIRIAANVFLIYFEVIHSLFSSSKAGGGEVRNIKTEEFGVDIKLKEENKQTNKYFSKKHSKPGVSNLSITTLQSSTYIISLFHANEHQYREDWE